MQIAQHFRSNYPIGLGKSYYAMQKVIELHKGPKNPPAPISIGQKEHETISRMMPKYPKIPGGWGHSIPEIKCSTCQRTYTTYKGRNKHQKWSATCIVRQKPEKYTTSSLTTTVKKPSPGRKIENARHFAAAKPTPSRH